MHRYIFLLWFCLAFAKSQSSGRGNIFWTNEFFLQRSWAPYAAQDETPDKDQVILEINDDMTQGYDPSFVMCPSISPDTLPDFTSTNDLNAMDAFQAANATTAKPYHYDVSKRFGKVINPGNFENADQANKHYLNILGDVSNRFDYAGFFAFRPNFREQAGPQARYRGPPFDFDKAFEQEDIVPLKKDAYWWAWAQYVAVNRNKGPDWDRFVQHSYVVRDPVLCWSLLLSARLQNKVNAPSAVRISGDNLVSPVRLWTNKCVSACTADKIRNQVSCDGKSLAECKAECLNHHECKGVFFNSAENIGAYVMETPSESDLTDIGGKYDVYLERYVEDVRGRAFARLGTYPLTEYVDDLFTYQMRANTSSLAQLKRPDDCFALQASYCYVNETGWYTTADPGVVYDRVYTRRGEHTPASCKAKCHLDPECLAWTWTSSTCRITTGIGQLTTATARADENVMRNLGLDPTKPCSGTNMAFDTCRQTCVDIREPLQMGWCNKQWVHCVNPDDTEVLPEISQTTEVHVIHSMWNQTGCTTTSLPMDTLGRYISLIPTVLNTNVDDTDTIATEMKQWCDCAVQGGDQCKIGLKTRPDNTKTHIYDVSQAVAYEGCMPRQSGCTVSPNYGVAFNEGAVQRSDPHDLRVCVGGFFENTDFVEADPSTFDGGRKSQHEHFRTNMKRTRRTLDGTMKGAYEADECGNVGAGIIYGDGELDRWAAWSYNTLKTSKTRMPANQLTKKSDAADTLCRIPVQNRTKCTSNVCCEDGNSSYEPRSPLRLPGFMSKTFVTGYRPSDSVGNKGTEYASVTAGVESTDGFSYSGDCKDKSCIHPMCTANNAQVWAPTCLQLTLQEMYDLINKYELANSLVKSAERCKDNDQCVNNVIRQCQKQYGTLWTQGKSIQGLLNTPFSQGTGWEVSIDETQLQNYVRYTCPPSACFNPHNYLHNSKLSEQDGMPLDDCMALTLSGTQFTDSATLSDENSNSKALQTLVQYLATGTFEFIPSSFGRIFADSPFCKDELTLNFDHLKHLLTDKAQKAMSSSNKKTYNTQNAQRTCADVNPKSLHNAEECTTYGYDQSTGNSVQSPQPSQLHFTEKINSPNSAEGNSANMGLMCPIGVQQHNFAQLTLKCPASKPIRCSHLSVIQPAGGTCAYSLDEAQQNGIRFTGQASTYADRYEEIKFGDDPILDEYCSFDNSTCKKAVTDYAVKNGCSPALSKNIDRSDVIKTFRGGFYDICRRNAEITTFVKALWNPNLPKLMYEDITPTEDTTPQWWAYARMPPLTTQSSIVDTWSATYKAIFMASLFDFKTTRSNGMSWPSFWSNVQSKYYDDPFSLALIEYTKTQFSKQKFTFNKERNAAAAVDAFLNDIDICCLDQNGPITMNKGTVTYENLKGLDNVAQTPYMLHQQEPHSTDKFETDIIIMDSLALVPEKHCQLNNIIFSGSGSQYANRANVFMEYYDYKDVGFNRPTHFFVQPGRNFKLHYTTAHRGRGDPNKNNPNLGYFRGKYAVITLTYSNEIDNKYDNNWAAQETQRLNDLKCAAVFQKFFAFDSEWGNYFDWNNFLYVQSSVKQVNNQRACMNLPLNLFTPFDSAEVIIPGDWFLTAMWNENCVITLSGLFDFLQQTAGKCNFQREQCLTWNDHQQPTIEKVEKTETAQYSNKIMQNSACHVYDVSCHTVEDANRYNVCGKLEEDADNKPDLQTMSGVPCGTKPTAGLQGGFCGADENRDMVDAEQAHQRCSTWPTGNLRICSPGYSLVWINDQPICQLSVAANKSAAETNMRRVLPTMRVSSSTLTTETSLYYVSSRCTAQEVATESGQCVPLECDQRSTDQCEQNDLMHSPTNKQHSCTLDGDKCIKHVETTIEQQSDIWWPGFVKDDNAFAGVGPAYVDQFDACDDVSHGCQGFTLCGRNTQVSAQECLTSEHITQRCCSGVGVSDEGLQCVSAPTTVCAGGQTMFYTDNSALSATNSKAKQCTKSLAQPLQQFDANNNCQCCQQECAQRASAVINQARYSVETGVNSGYKGTVQELFVGFVDRLTRESVNAQSCLGAEERLSGSLYKDGSPSCACRPREDLHTVSRGSNDVSDIALAKWAYPMHCRVDYAQGTAFELAQACAIDDQCIGVTTAAPFGKLYFLNTRPITQYHVVAANAMCADGYTEAPDSVESVELCAQRCRAEKCKMFSYLTEVVDGVRKGVRCRIGTSILSSDGFASCSIVKQEPYCVAGMTCNTYSTVCPVDYQRNEKGFCVHQTKVSNTGTLVTSVTNNHALKATVSRQTVCDPTVSCAYTQPDYEIHGFLSDEHNVTIAQTDPQFCRAFTDVKMAAQWCISAGAHCIGLVQTTTNICAVMQDDPQFTTQECSLNPRCGTVYYRSSAALHAFQWKYDAAVIGTMSAPHRALVDSSTVVAKCAADHTCTGIQFLNDGAVATWHGTTPADPVCNHWNSAIWDPQGPSSTISKDWTTCTQNGQYYKNTNLLALCVNGVVKWVADRSDVYTSCVGKPAEEMANDAEDFVAGPPGTGQPMSYARKIIIGSQCPEAFPYAYDDQGISGSRCCQTLFLDRKDSIMYFGPHVFSMCSSESVPCSNENGCTDHVNVKRCPAHLDCVHGKSVHDVNTNTCKCICDPFFTGPLCDTCSRDNTNEDCATCKTNFILSEEDTCICPPGFDVSTGCTTCLAGFLPPDCKVDTCTYELTPARVGDKYNVLDNVVVAYNTTNMLYDGLYAAGDGRVPHTMQNSFVHQDGRLFWLHTNTRTEIVGFDVCTIYNEATKGCSATEYELRDGSIFHCNTSALVASVPNTCNDCVFKSNEDAQNRAFSTVLAQCDLSNDGVATLRIDEGTCVGTCAVDGRSCKSSDGTMHCCVSQKWMTGACDQIGDTYRSITHFLTGSWLYSIPREQHVASRLQIITNNETWGARCWIDGATAGNKLTWDVSLQSDAQDYDDNSILLATKSADAPALCAAECAQTLCSAFLWQDSTCRLIKHDAHLRSADYYVDPEHCVSGGFQGTGRWRNLPNDVSLAVPRPNELLHAVPTELYKRLVCAYDENSVFYLSQYRRHDWTTDTVTCSHPHVVGVQTAWLHSLPRGQPVNMQTVHDAPKQWLSVTGTAHTTTTADECALLCSESCTIWYFDGIKCVVHDNGISKIDVLPAHTGGYALPSSQQLNDVLYKLYTRCVVLMHPSLYDDGDGSLWAQRGEICAPIAQKYGADVQYRPPVESLEVLAAMNCVRSFDSNEDKLRRCGFLPGQHSYRFEQPTSTVAVQSSVSSTVSYTAQDCCRMCGSFAWRFDGSECSCFDVAMNGHDSCWTPEQPTDLRCQGRVSMIRYVSEQGISGNTVFNLTAAVSEKQCSDKCAQAHSCRYAVFADGQCTGYDRNAIDKTLNRPSFPSVEKLTPSWKATGCTTECAGCDLTYYQSFWNDAQVTSSDVKEKILEDMYQWCLDAAKGGDNNDHEQGCCGKQGCGSSLTCTKLDNFKDDIFSVSDSNQLVLYEKKGGCVQDGKNCVYGQVTDFKSGVTTPQQCSANGAVAARNSKITLYYAEHDKQSVQATLSSCSGDAHHDMQLQPRALSTLRNARLQTVDSNLILHRIQRIHNAWGMSSSDRFADGLGGLAFAFTPTYIATFDPHANSHVTAERLKMVVPENTDKLRLRIFEATAPVPRASSSRSACEKQAALATLSVGMDRTPAVDQCFSIGSCVPAANDAGALDDVYNTYAEQLQSCMAADHADHQHPVPVAVVIQPGSAFVLGSYQDIPVYYAPNKTNAYGYYVRFGSTVNAPFALTPTPPPFDVPTPPPLVRNSATLRTFNDCAFESFANTTLHAQALPYVEVVHASTNIETESACGAKCAMLLTCRMFVFADDTCTMYSLLNIGSALCKENGCSSIWVDDAENKCAVTLAKTYHRPKKAATLHVKSDCCIIKLF